MSMLNGIHHVATLTNDLGRLIDFYGRVFDASVTLDLTEDGLRHAFIEVGPGTVLHPFEAPFLEIPQGEVPLFQRGRLDHIAFRASSEKAFWELRERLLDEQSAPREVVDMGMLLNFGFVDPDGAEHEVVWIKDPDIDPLETLRSKWKVVEEG